MKGYIMNQILITEKIYITRTLRKKKKIYQVIFIISLVIVTILTGYYINTEYEQRKGESVSKDILKSYESLKETTIVKDDVLVVFRDDDLMRMCGYDGILQEKTYEEIKKYSLLDTKEKIPTFQEVLDLVNDKVFLDIEVKGTKRIQKTCDVLLKLLEGHNNSSRNHSYD